MKASVRITQIDGKLPNLALMKIAHWHRARGHHVTFSKHVERGLWEPGRYDVAYGSATFSHSAPRVHTFLEQFPEAVVGGTWNPLETATVESILERHYLATGSGVGDAAILRLSEARR